MTTRPKTHRVQSSSPVNTVAENSDDGQFAESAYGYNPIFQKRVTLGIDRTPGGGYHYYGPPPDVGTSYGCWSDEANKIGAIAPVVDNGTTLFSPVSGAEMKYEGPANQDVLEAVLSFKGEYQLMPATSSGHTCLTSAPIYGDLDCPAMYSPFTGEDITEAYLAMKAQKQTTNKEKNMSTEKKKPVAATAASDGPAQNSFKVKKITVPKVGQENIPYSKDGNSMKPASMSGVDSSKDGLNKATNSHGSDEPEKEKTVKQSSIKPAGNVKVPDVGMDSLPHAHGSKAKKPVEAMSDDELVAALESELAKADSGSEMPKLSIEFEGEGGEGGGEDMPPPPPPPPSSEPSMESAPPPPSAPMSEPPPAESDMMGLGTEEPPAAMPHEELGPDGMPMHSEEDPQIPVLEVPPADAMNMPYAHVELVRKLRATAAALRAGVKIDKAEQDALMAKAAAALRKGKKPAAKGQSDSLLSTLSAKIEALTKQVAELRKPVAAAPAASPAAKPVVKPQVVKAEDSDPKSSDEEKVEEIMEKDDAGKAEGVHFEVLQSLDVLENEGITASSISAQMFAESGVNPFWNITVHGEPLARIYLQDQERPDEIRSSFTSPAYGEALAKASEQIEGGLRKLLHDANARFFTLQIDKVNVAKKAKEAATAEAKKVITEKLSTLSDRFLECMATAAIGMDRNFFPGGNPLKHAFHLQMHAMGIPNEQAFEAIESAFSEASADHFKALASKATELMSMEPVAFEQYRAAILQAGVVKPVAPPEQDSNAIATATVQNSQSMVQHLVEQSNAIAGVNMAVMGGKTLSEKETLRRELGLNSTTIMRR